MAVFGKLVFFAIISVLTAILSAYTISTLWQWFIVPTFELKPLNMIQSLGLALFVSYLTHQINIKDDSNFDNEFLIKMTTFSICKPLVFLVVGYFCHLFM